MTVSSPDRAEVDAKEWMRYRGTPGATVYQIPDINNKVRLVVQDGSVKP